MRDALEAARPLLPDARLEDVGRLRGGQHSEVRRALVHRDGEPTVSVIVKQFHTAGEGWARESAALSLLTPSILAADAPGPRLIAAAAEPPVVIMSDAGPGASVADALLATDASAAAAALDRWAEAIARLHRATLRARAAFTIALDERAGDLPIAAQLMPIMLEDAARAVADQAAGLGIATPSAALDELRGLAHRLGGEGVAAISPADACPDNNVSVGGQLVLVDFEGAQWRHIAWDVAYLLVPWPSCWCAWRMPDEVADRAVARYRDVLAAELDYVATPDFEHDVVAAAAGWALVSSSWFLNAALVDDRPVLHAEFEVPSRRALILHRLGVSARCAQLPALAALAAELRASLVQRWGELPLAVAPAFAGHVGQ